MGYIPRPTPTQQLEAERAQTYQQQFNNSQYAAIPGVRGPQPMPEPYTYTWNGEQRTYDPTAPAPQPSGWARGAGALFENMMPGLRAGWMNATLSDADWQTFLPQGQGGTAQNHMVRAAPPAAMSGRYGSQAMQLAGLLGTQAAAGNGGGLLGGPRRGFRVPGGK